MMRGTGDITVSTNPQGATIYVDSTLTTNERGEPLTTPVKLTLNEGMHRFMLVRSGYSDDYEHVYIFPGSDLMLHRDLAYQYPPTPQ